jgi:hypothetical protein
MTRRRTDRTINQRPINLLEILEGGHLASIKFPIIRAVLVAHLRNTSSAMPLGCPNRIRKIVARVLEMHGCRALLDDRQNTQPVKRKARVYA